MSGAGDRAPASPPCRSRRAAVGDRSLVAILVVGLVVGSFALARLTPAPEPAEAAQSAAPTRLTTPKPTVTPAVAEAAADRDGHAASRVVHRARGADRRRPGRPTRTRPAGSGSGTPSTPTIRWPRRPRTCCCSATRTARSACAGSCPDGVRTDPPGLVLVRRDDELQELARTTVTSRSTASPVAGDEPAAYQVALDASPDGRTGYLAAGRSDRATTWQVSLGRHRSRCPAAVVDTTDLLVLPRGRHVGHPVGGRADPADRARRPPRPRRWPRSSG